MVHRSRKGHRIFGLGGRSRHILATASAQTKDKEQYQGNRR